MKKISLLIVAAFGASLLFSFAKMKKQKVLKTIIIDAGHGIMETRGHNGAKGSYSYEDEICYAVSKKLVAEIKKHLPEIKIIETRPTTKIVSLYRRADIANENKGDLFISIHVNSAPAKRNKEFIGNKTVVSYTGKGKRKKKVTRQVPQYRYYTTPSPANGTETYIWGAGKADDKEVAIRENAAIMQEENYKEKYGDIDVNSAEFHALALLKAKQYFKRSATLAGFVEDEFYNLGRTSRGEKQRTVGIWVLQATAMPSILVETGYISNRAEEDYLNSAKGQQELAEGITKAVQTYIAWIEKNQSKETNDNNNTAPAKPRPFSAANGTKSFLEMVEHKEKRTRTK
jgi:N-acetylmuramoyl-L-alanine amidase